MGCDARLVRRRSPCGVGLLAALLGACSASIEGTALEHLTPYDATVEEDAAASSDAGVLDARGDGDVALARDGSDGEAGDAIPDAPAPTFDRLRDAFTTTANPSGRFSYGFVVMRGDPLRLFDQPVIAHDMPAWQSVSTPDRPPYVAKNPLATSASFGTTVTVPGNSVFMHPGASGESAVVRWTCPRPGVYEVIATFEARDATTSDAAILRNGTPFFAQPVAVGSPASVTATLALEGGDLLDFMVGFGTNASFFKDATGLELTVRSL